LDLSGRQTAILNIKGEIVMAKHLCFLVTAALLTASQPALAAPTTLICNTGLPLDMGPATVDLDEAQSAVTLHLPA